MTTQPDDAALEALDDQSLRSRLERRDWKNDPLFVTDEQVYRLLRRADAVGRTSRVGMLSRELGKRTLEHAKSFAYRSGLHRSFGSLDQAAEELSQYVWECLSTRPGDAAHAEGHFGQLFKRRALDFQRRLLAKKRQLQVNIADMAGPAGAGEEDDDDPDVTIRKVLALRDHATPDDALQVKQAAAAAASRLEEVLTKNEYIAFVLLYVNDMQVQQIAASLRVSLKSVNNYKNAALRKIAADPELNAMKKEFNT